MKVKKTVTLSTEEIFEFFKKHHPGLNRATHMELFGRDHDLNGWIDFSWVEEEVIDGIYKPSKELV